MRVVTHLREIRVAADLSLTEVEDLTGVGRGTLSKIERGVELPADKYVDALELAYGAPAHWYPPEVLLLIQKDREEVEA